MELYTKSRGNGIAYDATATYSDGIVVVKRGSKINRLSQPSYKMKGKPKTLRADDSLFENDCYLIKDIEFNSLSTAASFVTGRTANGKIVWKTQNGKALKYTLR